MFGVQDLHAGWGERVAEERAACGMTKAALAARCGVEPSTITRIESGVMCPRDELKWKLAGALGVRMDVLFAWPRIVPPDPSGEDRAA